MNIKITKCDECPFMWCNRDDDKFCHHPRYYQKGVVDVYNYAHHTVPDFCPILNDPITLTIDKQ